MPCRAAPRTRLFRSDTNSVADSRSSARLTASNSARFSSVYTIADAFPRESDTYHCRCELAGKDVDDWATST